jgi:hypothetical protein
LLTYFAPHPNPLPVNGEKVPEGRMRGEASVTSPRPLILPIRDQIIHHRRVRQRARIAQRAEIILGFLPPLPALRGEGRGEGPSEFSPTLKVIPPVEPSQNRSQDTVEIVENLRVMDTQDAVTLGCEESGTPRVCGHLGIG